MSATQILEILASYLETSKNGTADELEHLRKDFAYTLNEYLDFRIKALIENPEFATDDRKILIHESHDIVELISLIASVPRPPTDHDNIDVWIEAYRDWYVMCEAMLNHHTYKRDTDISELTQK